VTVVRAGHRASGGRAGSGAATLAARLAERDHARFSGREGELAFLDRCLSDDPPACVVFLHGPGGIGKSTLLREFERRAGAQGWDCFHVEARELSPTSDALLAALGDAQQSSRPLLLIDTYERMSGLDGYLRRALLPSLPGNAVILIAGRHAPDPAWLTGIWEGVSAELPLEKFSRADSLRLLEAYGVSDKRASAIADWAEGSPLVLALAADTALKEPDWTPHAELESSEIMRSLIRRLVDSELQGERLSALGVAAIARVTTVELLRAVLPESEAEIAYERLRELSFTEPLGDGLALHELVRKALRADFRTHDPERERELRRRIIDHLYERARDGGDPLLMIDMAHLIDNSIIKWGFGWEGSVDYRIDDARPEDSLQIALVAQQHGFDDWWNLTSRFFEESPERVAVARDRKDQLCGYMVCMSLATAPEFAWEDPLVGPWLAHARNDAALGEAVLWHDSVDFTRERGARVQAMLGIAGILRSGVVNPRFAYMPINPSVEGAVSFAQALGAEHIKELDLDLEPRRIECHRIDYGPGGLMAAQRAVVYTELGLPNPQSARLPVEVDPEAVRDALRNFRLPHELAQSPLALGENQEERVESVRRLLREAVDSAFGDTDNEQLLRRVLVRGYMEPVSSHEQAAYEISLSRAAYFRRLRTAAERVAEHLAGGGRGK
jgi:hypothetical protein